MFPANENFKNRTSLRNLVAFLSGLIFAYGLFVGGMTDPKKIISFLDLLGKWDPQLLFVMIGALLIHIPAYLYFKKRAHPILDSKKHIPTGKEISKELIIGAFIFGVGWALSGYCPGPGLVSAMDGNWSAVTFAIAMTVGMAIHHFYRQFFSKEISY